MERLLIKGNRGTYYTNPTDKHYQLSGRGKFSIVYQGVCLENKQAVVIKKFNIKAVNSEWQQYQYFQEAQINIEHPNIAKVLDYAIDEESYYIIKEYIFGQSLKSIIQNTAFKNIFFIRCIIEVLKALEVLHKHQLYHRDIKPSNIMVQYKNQDKEIDTDQPKIKLIDLGLAKTATNKEKQKTIPFSLIYGAPEQLLNLHNLINATTDIYATGIVLYQCVGKSLPFINENPLKLMTLQLTEPLPRQKNMDKKLFSIINKASYKHIFSKPPHQYPRNELLKMLADAQNQRFQTAGEFIACLEDAITEINQPKKSWIKNLFKK